ncbi:hypothetical protein [Haloferula helveola]
MKRALFSALLMAGLIGPGTVVAIPTNVFGPIVQSDSPLNGEDLTDQVLAALAGDGQLPGEWVAEGAVGASEISHLLARPVLFDREVVILRAVRRDGNLERVEATFADAGSFFGYFDEDLPDGLSRRQAEEAVQAKVKERQDEFSKLYTESLETVRDSIAEVADKPRAKEVRFGKGRTLRAEVEEWRKGDLAVRLFAADERLVRVMIGKSDRLPAGWIDPAFESESERDRSARLAAAVKKDSDGTVRIEGLQPMPQGYKPYCGLNTLAMAARHLGLTLDEDWLAAAGGFQNTGSAAGSDMVKLYHAVASEAGLGMDRANDFDESDVKAALSEGRPVVVWRRFSWERNKLHDRIAAGDAEMPDPNDPAEASSWPDEDAPLHASVLTGFDPEKREVFFLETWSGKDTPRRMRFEEMESTAYLTFVFTD